MDSRNKKSAQIDENILNCAGWRFIDEWRLRTDQKMDGRTFNSIKSILRPTIEFYIENASSETIPNPFGFIAKCKCGKSIGAMQIINEDQGESSRILIEWLRSGYTIEPQLDKNWSVMVELCECKGRK